MLILVQTHKNQESKFRQGYSQKLVLVYVQLHSFTEAGHRISVLHYKPGHGYTLQKTNFLLK